MPRSRQWESLQQYSINWITVLLSFIGDELGEEAVERALRRTGDDFVRPRRDTGTDWDSLPASARAKVIARAMLVELRRRRGRAKTTRRSRSSFRCGSGGRLIDDGRYEGDARVPDAPRAERPDVHARRACPCTARTAR